MGKKKWVPPEFSVEYPLAYPFGELPKYDALDRVIQLNETIISEPNPDMVNHPPHYTSDPSGVECITITRHRNFNVGNAIKYLWRNGLKDSGSAEKQIQDLEKAIFYIKDEITRLTIQQS